MSEIAVAVALIRSESINIFESLGVTEARMEINPSVPEVCLISADRRTSPELAVAFSVGVPAAGGVSRENPTGRVVEVAARSRRNMS